MLSCEDQNQLSDLHEFKLEHAIIVRNQANQDEKSISVVTKYIRMLTKEIFLNLIP